jgi:hypothetical protein
MTVHTMAFVVCSPLPGLLPDRLRARRTDQFSARAYEIWSALVSAFRFSDVARVRPITETPAQPVVPGDLTRSVRGPWPRTTSARLFSLGNPDGPSTRVKEPITGPH